MLCPWRLAFRLFERVIDTWGVGSADSDKVNETLSGDIITAYGNNISDDINMVSRLREEGYMMG